MIRSVIIKFATLNMTIQKIPGPFREPSSAAHMHGPVIVRNATTEIATHR